MLFRKLRKRKLFNIIGKSNIKNKYPNIFNFILFNIIIFLLLKNIENGYIEIRVNQFSSNNKLISDAYERELPNNIYLNLNGIEVLQNVNIRNTNIDFGNNLIKLEWEHALSDFSYMFSDLTSITEVYMDQSIFDSNYNINMKYMFRNCLNLIKFSYRIDYGESYIIKNMEGMFYNCPSLLSFNFDDFYLDSYQITDAENNIYYIYNNLNLAYMFYNCQSLENISFNEEHRYCNITNAEKMFYNCSSLTSINLTNFGFDDKVDLFNMFYNCKNLETIIMPYSYDNFGISNMYQMFYNCESLKEIEIKISKRYEDYIDMSQLFYNCNNLTSINIINFELLYISNFNEMFYNCFSLESIEIKPYYINDIESINMNKMFYNCYSIKSITFDIDYNNDLSESNNNKNFYYPNDMSYMFYNCIELEKIIFKYFNTTYTQNMTYMLYNCENLNNFDITYSNFSNTLINDMKGMFQNLRGLNRLDLTNFYTPNVIMMWDMFNGCTNLISLYIRNFDTSKVTDMESMFDGCSNLISLDINNFNTTNVQYMNKMFQNCISLKSLYFKYLTTESLGTMYRMFYNCKDLVYLNLYSLTESGQSIVQMFDDSSYTFKLCIKEEENIPNIFQILNETSFERDCSDFCYGTNNQRIYIQSKKICCAKYVYKEECLDRCPIRTKDTNRDKICEDLNCSYYYDYGQESCSNNNSIPDGYYMNSTELKTIDKCYENCRTCNRTGNNLTMNCLTCKEETPFLYLGNCFNSCLYGEYEDDNGIKRCKCYNRKCSKCSERSLILDLCEECNEGFYPKKEEYIINQRFFNCYKEPEEYYLDEVNGKKMYRHCYPSCQYCIQGGDKYNHFCTSCNYENSFSIIIENKTFSNDTNTITTYMDFTSIIDYNNNSNYSGLTLMNCYQNCPYNYYFDEDGNYTCLHDPGCPDDRKLLIYNTRECVKTCEGLENKYEFQVKCFRECPPESTSDIIGTGFFCKADCPKQKPFELIITQTCYTCCKIMERYNNSCILNYKGNITDAIHDIIMTCIKEDIVDTFDYNFITENQSLILEDSPYVYEITSTDCTYVKQDLGRVRLGNCAKVLKDYYGIDRNDPLYILKVDAFVDGKIGPKTEYEVYYPFTDKLHQLDISICEGIDISIDVPINITIDNIDKYDRNSGYYNDICYKYTNENGADVTLEDRQEEFGRYNRSICDENCRLVGVDSNNERAECSCDLVFNIPFASQIVVNKDKLYKFMNIKNIANFKIMICYKLFFSSEGIKENIGFYCLLLTLVVYFICLIYFYKKDYKPLKVIVNEIVFAKKNEKYLEKKYKFKFDKRKKSVFRSYIQNKKLENQLDALKLFQEEKNKNNNLDNKNNSDLLNKQEKKDEINKTKNETINPVEETKEKEIRKANSNSSGLVNKENNIKNAPPIRNKNRTKNKIDIVKYNSSTKMTLNSKRNSIHIINKKYFEKFNEKQKKKIRFILSYIDAELNDLSYKKAVEDDNRTYFQYYYSLLITNHTFIKIFNKRDYNAYSIKVLLFFFDFASNYAVNALFFTDDTMHQIYKDSGDYNIIYQLPQIIYSTIISVIIDNIISYLGLSQDDILSVKHVKKVKDVERRAKEVLRTLHIKFIFFFIINFIFITIFWYYLGCFCAVYTNTQFHLIKDTLISFGTSSITPLGKSLIPGIFRIPTLHKYGKGKKVIYLLSQFLQKI